MDFHPKVDRTRDALHDARALQTHCQRARKQDAVESERTLLTQWHRAGSRYVPSLSPQILLKDN